MPQPLPTFRKIFDLEGEAQVNADGVSRQEELRRCIPGEPVHLRLRASDGISPADILVLTSRRVPIGRLTRKSAVLLAPFLAAGRPYRAKLHCLRGGLPHYPLYGARISIAWDRRPDHPHRPLDQEQLRYRGQWAAKQSSGPTYRPDPVRSVLTGSDPDLFRICLVLLGILAYALIALPLARFLASSWCWACG